MGNNVTLDEYFFGIAEAVSRKSHCLSHKFGAVAIRDKTIIATGYNGPPRGYPHCEGIPVQNCTGYAPGKLECPRHAIGFKSGQGLEICPAAHAESNVLIAAARIGHSLLGCTLYTTSPIPCRECSKLIVNAGIIKVVVMGGNLYYSDIGLSGKNILTTCGVEIVILGGYSETSG